MCFFLLRFGFYEQMGYSVPNEDDLSAFEEFSKVYHSVASHNTAFNAGNLPFCAPSLTPFPLNKCHQKTPTIKIYIVANCYATLCFSSKSGNLFTGNARYTQEVNCFATVSSKSLQATFVLMTPEPNQDEMIG